LDAPKWTNKPTPDVFAAQSAGMTEHIWLQEKEDTPAVDIAGAQTSSGSDKQNLPGKRSRGKDYCTDDTSLDCMDEEERNEELFHAVIRNSLAGMFPEGRAEERSCNGPPRTIMFAN
jgi:hypothetical protein